MKIREITLYPVHVPLVPLAQGGIAPYIGSRDDAAGTRQGTTEAVSILFKVETDEGVTGWGEMNPVLSLSLTRQFVEDLAKPVLIGQDPFQIRQLLARFEGVYNPQLYTGTFLSGIEMACWDIKGKAVGRPVCDLLGGAVRTKMPVAYCLGMLPPDVLREKTVQIRQQGFSCIKLKGGNSVADDILRTRLVREAAGPAMRLRMDVNQSYDMPAALTYLRAVEDCGLEYVEQPLPAGRVADMASLRGRSKVPLAINEDCYLPGNFAACLRGGAIDAAVVDLEALGGIGALARLGVLAGEAGLPLAHHCGFDMGVKTAAILQAVCACPSFTCATDSTYHAHADDILRRRFVLEDGCYRLPAGPGLGVEVDEEKVAFYSLGDCTRRFL